VIKALRDIEACKVSKVLLVRKALVVSKVLKAL
jgi:hypothetical protein